MKNLIFKVGGLAASLALFLTTVSVNQACEWFIYQEKLPKTAKSLRKF